MAYIRLDLECNECSTIILDKLCDNNKLGEEKTCPQCGDMMDVIFTTPISQVNKETGYGETKRNSAAWGKYVEAANLKADMVGMPEEKRKDHKKEIKKLESGE